MRIDDYTQMQLGAKIDNGEIKTCPHCGRAGLAEEVYGKMFFTHLQTCGFNEQGQPELRWDMCPQQPIALKTTSK